MNELTSESDAIVPKKDSLAAVGRALFASALRDCSIDRAVERLVRVLPAGDGSSTLLLGTDAHRRIDLSACQQVRIVAVGKAAGSMLQAVLARLAILPETDICCVLIAPSQPAALPAGFQFFAGGHPLPNQASFAGARAALDLIATPPGTGVPLNLFLVSGGASAMMELPLDSTISLEDTTDFHLQLIHCGASIAEINCVRKHFSAVKGGRLTMAAGSSPCVSLFVSDVPAMHLDALGSGPTLPDRTTLDDCRAVLVRHGLLARFPASVRRFFLDTAVPETPKPADFSAQAHSLLDSDSLAEAARRRAEELGFHAIVDNSCDEWEYRAAADYLLARLRILRRLHARICLISVGEVTVSIPQQRLSASMVGGRNQHFALYTASRLEGSDGAVAVLSAGSDGIDGNSHFAGAVVDPRTLENPRIRSEAHAALLDFRSSLLLQRVGATIATGPTGNNLRDLRLFLAG